MDDTAKQKIKEGIQLIATNLPNLITLTPDERMELPKMGERSLSFVTKSLEYARQFPNIIPKYLSTDEFAVDLTSVQDLFAILVPLRKLVEELEDTQMLAGSEAYAAALVFYNAVKRAVADGETGLKAVYDDLSQRYMSKSGKTTTETKA